MEDSESVRIRMEHIEMLAHDGVHAAERGDMERCEDLFLTILSASGG